jgi:hypothetical protein
MRESMGSSSMHGPHQVAQKLTTAMEPCKPEIICLFPLRSFSSRLGARLAWTVGMRQQIIRATRARRELFMVISVGER